MHVSRRDWSAPTSTDEVHRRAASSAIPSTITATRAIRRAAAGRSTREPRGVDQKARRYLAEGRLQVLEVGPTVVRATCRGDGAVYRLGWWRGRWGCQCPAAGQFRASCAHLLALRLVVVEPAGLTPSRMRAEQDEASRVRSRTGVR